MAITISPVGLTAAAVPNELHVLAVIKERLCRSFCVNSEILPQAFVEYTAGTPRLQGTTLFIPVNARVTVVAKGGGCKADPYLFNETFLIAFANVTALPTAVNITTDGHEVRPAFLCGCTQANGVSINDALTITITPATAAGA